MQPYEYDGAFSLLLENLMKSRDRVIAIHKEINEAFNPIICTGDPNFSQYSKMVKDNERQARITIEQLAWSLFKEKAVHSFSSFPLEKLYPNMSPRLRKMKKPPFKIVLKNGSRTIGVAFCESYDEVERHERAFICHRYPMDELLLVRLIEPNAEAYKLMITDSNEDCKKDGYAIKHMTLKEFWCIYFGETEYRVLVESINTFNRKAHEIIGFSTTVIPSESAIAKFRKAIGEQLKEYSCEAAIPAEMYRSTVEVMKDNYFGRGLWRAMIGKREFALSFITSEWQCRMYELTENLDLTWAATGYLKSVEQLLYAVIALNKDEGLKAQDYRRNPIDFIGENDDIVDTSLGALTWMVNNNTLLSVNNFAQTHLTKTIKKWRDNRNDLFHKGAIKTIAQLDEIRKDAYNLYFLILGSFEISDEQFAELGIIEE